MRTLRFEPLERRDLLAGDACAAPASYDVNDSGDIGPADVLDHATTELAVSTKMGIDATRKLPGEGHKRGWPPLIRMDDVVHKRIDELLQG